MYDIIFIGKKNDSYKRLKSRFITLKHASTFEEAQKKCITKFFWVVWDHLDVNDDFDFDYIIDSYDEKYNHVFLNQGEHDGGIALIRKNYDPVRKEIDNKTFIKQVKNIEVEASRNTPFDIVFISYEEPDADANFKALQQRFPRAKRVHGVKGIHQAHIAAAQLCDTDMFWIVDGDAHIVDEFNFDHRVSSWDRDVVHVWRSQNPINGLIYGYGGIKLFPTQLTIEMDTSKPDMTTSISHKFKAMQDISNITAFNVDPFNTWKSAFRECCKLASKVIDRQKDEETDRRLKIWTTIGQDKPFGKYALLGARRGMMYGSSNKGDIEALKKINDFEWLKEQFNASST